MRVISLKPYLFERVTQREEAEHALWFVPHMAAMDKAARLKPEDRAFRTSHMGVDT